MSRLRILGGDLKGRSLEVPSTARPSGARLREALFSIWAYDVRGSLVLDLFAGSGAVGFEALSRGAAGVVAVEADGRAARMLRRNAEALEIAERLEVVRARLPVFGPWSPGRRFDLVFADPPYEFEEWGELLRGVEGLLEPEGRVACEHRSPIEVPIGWTVEGKERRYGDSRLTLLERSTAPD